MYFVVVEIMRDGERRREEEKTQGHYMSRLAFNFLLCSYVAYAGCKLRAITLPCLEKYYGYRWASSHLDQLLDLMLQQRVNSPEVAWLHIVF